MKTTTKQATGRPQYEISEEEGLTPTGICTGCKLELPTRSTHLGTELCPFCLTALWKEEKATFSNDDLRWANRQSKSISRVLKQYAALLAVAEAAQKVYDSPYTTCACAEELKESLAALAAFNQ